MSIKDMYSYKNRFGIFFRKNIRIYSPFFETHKYLYISGHKGLDLFIGNYQISLIYKF